MEMFLALRNCCNWKNILDTTGKTAIYVYFCAIFLIVDGIKKCYTEKVERSAILRI